MWQCSRFLRSPEINISSLCLISPPKSSLLCPSKSHTFPSYFGSKLCFFPHNDMNKGILTLGSYLYSQEHGLIGGWSESKGRVPKKNVFFMVFYQTKVDGSEKPYCFFEEKKRRKKIQRACRIILGPPKNVLHLVCIVLDISTAIKTALKVAVYDFFDE